MAHVKEEPLPDVGVIVGRFQVPELHEGHRDVLDYVVERHDKVILFLGVPGHQQATMENPLDSQAREQMIREEYPEIIVRYIKDEQSDEYWSKKLDGQIKDHITPNQTVMLYGSRDSFISHYQGRFPTQELEAEHKVSGTEIRARIKRHSTKGTVEFREGAVWATYARFPTTYTTVDVAVFDEDFSHILLGRKPHESAWRLPGGFAEPTSESFEQDARREVQEETNLSITDPEYIGSFKIDDWRYRGERDKIKTLLFMARRQFGEVKAGDDLEEVKWFPLSTLDIETDIMPNHRVLVEAALDEKFFRRNNE